MLLTFWANIIKNSGILLIFHTYVFGQKCLALPKLTELLRLIYMRAEGQSALPYF